MKKTIFIALLGLSLAACNNDDLPAIANNDAEAPLMENFRSEDEAIDFNPYNHRYTKQFEYFAIYSK